MTDRYRKTPAFLAADQYQRIKTSYHSQNSRYNITVPNLVDQQGRRWVAKKFDELMGTGESQTLEQRFEPTVGFTWISLTLLYRLMVGEHVPEACIVLNDENKHSENQTTLPIAYLSRQIEAPVVCSEKFQNSESLDTVDTLSDAFTLLKKSYQHTNPAHQFAPIIASWIVWDEHDRKADNLIIGDSFSPYGKTNDHQDLCEEQKSDPPESSKMLYKIDHDFSLRPYSVKYLADEDKRGYLGEGFPMHHRLLKGFITGDTNDRAVATYRHVFERFYYSHKHDSDQTKLSNQEKLNEIRQMFNNVIEDPAFQANFCFYVLKAALITKQMLKRVAERAFPESHEEDRQLLIKHAEERLVKLRKSLVAIPKFRQYLVHPTFITEEIHLSGAQAFEHLITQMTTIEALSLEETDGKISPLVSRVEIEQSYLSLQQQSLKAELKASPERRTRIYASSMIGSALGGATGLLIGALILSLTMPWVLVAFGIGMISSALLAGILQYFKEEAHIQTRLNEAVHLSVYQRPDWLPETSATAPPISTEDRTSLTKHSLFPNRGHHNRINSGASGKGIYAATMSSTSSGVEPDSDNDSMPQPC